MALAADLSDGSDFRRYGTMIAVAVITDRRRKIFLVEKSMGMNALSVLCFLGDGDFITCHVFFIRVTTPARLRDIPGKSPRFGMGSSLNSVNCMAIRADGNFLVSLF